MRTDLERIKEILNKHLDSLKEKYHVENIGVFGSVARGEQAQTSDIDVLVELSRPIGLFRFIELEEFLSQILGRKVDLVTKNALKPAIKEEVLRELSYV